MLKSYLSSISLHAAVIAALYLIPAGLQRKFATHGNNQAVVVEFSSPAANSELPSQSLRVLTPQPLTPQTTEAQVRPVQETRRWFDPTTPIHESLLDDSEVATKSTTVAPPQPTPRNIRQPTVQQPRIEDIKRIHTPRERLASSLEPPPQQVGVESDQSADLTNNPPPAYPLEAVRRKLEGIVLLQLSISVSGAVDQVKVLQSSGYRVLDSAAVDAVSKWKGQPAVRLGTPISSEEVLPIRFRL